MFSLADQLAALTPTPPPRLHAAKEEAADRARQTFDTLKGIGNATPARLAQELPYPSGTIKNYLRILMREGKIVSWRTGNSTWYSVARPPKRRK